MKMEKFEVKQEYKDTEGDPQIKSRRRQTAHEIAYQEGPKSVRRAKTVITNPTHLAVALEYDEVEQIAPKIVTMGQGIMAEKIIDAAIKENVDIIGLSGLITPSLDEMVYLAKEMDKLNIKIPIMIGGATTSRAHTAVKIAPEYAATVVHVNDASRAVTVASNLLNPETKTDFSIALRKEYDTLRDGYLNRAREKNFLTIEECVEALTIPTIVSDKNTEIQLRMLLMLTFNDRIRNGEKLFQKETDQTIWLKNLYDLKDLLDLTIDFNCIIVADIFRYLGKFEEAQELLAPFKNAELNWVTNQIEAQCIEKNTSDFELLMPNN
jgi:hypothetical protein